MSLTNSSKMLEINSNAPNFNLKATNGKIYSLNDFDKPLLIIFICNHCPFVKQKVDRINELLSKYKDKVHIIGINSNDEVNFPEDSFDKMIEFAKNFKDNFIYLHDPDQSIAKSYKATCTPDPFLFDKDKKLVYHGRLDDALDLGQKVTQKDMEKAIDSVLKGEKPDPSFLASCGCNIKWK